MNQMNKPLFITALLLSIAAGCSNDHSAPITEAQPAANTAAPLDCPAITTGYSYLPADVVFRFKHHLRNDRFTQDKQGNTRRRVAMEFLEGGTDTIARQIEQSMLEAGYTLGGIESNPESTVMKFRKKGKALTVVSILSSAGDNPVAPDAVGLVIVNFKP